jgi:ELWxxDGT repeat protein
MGKLRHFVTLAAIFVGRLAAQTPYQVTDLGTEPHYSGSSWRFDPSAEHVVAGERFYLFEDDGIHGSELWRTDGTAVGTFMVRDLCPGSCGSRARRPGQLAAISDRVVFAADDGVHGVELWITDGTASGTDLVVDLAAGYGSSEIRLLTSAGDQAFFVATPGAQRAALWRTDGTAKGTYPVVPPGPPQSFDPSSIHFGPGFLYLCNAAWSGETGLWRTDGSSPGTTFIAPVSCPSDGSSKTSSILVSPEGVLFFEGRLTTQSNDSELWRSDGTAAGTFRVKDVAPGPTSSSPSNFAWRQNELIFSVIGPTLWRSDGTEQGTVPIPLGHGATPELRYGSWGVAGERYYFAADDEEHGVEPWVYDGTTAARILDLLPGPETSIDYKSRQLFFEPLGDWMIFAASDGVWGNELWRSDGSAEGTTRISDVAPGENGIRFQQSWHLHPSSLHGRPLFVEHQPVTGFRLWRVMASGDGVELIRTIDDQTSLFEPSGTDRLSAFEAIRGDRCFQEAGSELCFDRWRSTRTGSVVVDLSCTDGAVGSHEELLIGQGSTFTYGDCGRHSGQLLYFTPDFGSGVPEWKLNGIDLSTGAREVLIEGVYPNSTPLFTPLSGRQVFAASGSFFATDGTGAGTDWLAGLDVRGGRIEPFREQLVSAEGSLWITDPLAEWGVRELLAETGSLRVEPELARLGNLLIFVADDAASGREIWKSDGTVEGTALVLDANAGVESTIPEQTEDRSFEYEEARLVSGETFVVFAGQSSAGAELWVTDGTAIGTHLLKDIYAGDYPSTPRNLTPLGGRVFFTAESELEGLELWVTDGSVAGTSIVKDIAPGGASSIPDDLVVRDGILYFSAWSPDFGREAWRSDGSAAGTVRMTDIAPGPKSSSPQRFERAGNRLFFSATDHVHGYELWAISDDGSIPLFLDGFEIGSALRWSDSEP